VAAVVAVLHRDSGWGRVAPPTTPGSISGKASAPAAPAPTVRAPAVPGGSVGRAAPAGVERAREVLAAIEAGGGQPLAAQVGGRLFQTREGRLPAGRSREYDLSPHTPGRDRGPERLVIDQGTGRAYYSADHYRTFVPIN